MRALVCRAWGEVDGLKLEDVEPPVPKTGEVLIDVRATPVNFADTIMVRGQYQTRPGFPFSPGLETAGVIARCGLGVTSFRPGDRVMALLDHGGMAEQAVAEAEQTWRIPDGMDFEEASVVPGRLPVESRRAPLARPARPGRDAAGLGRRRRRRARRGGDRQGAGRTGDRGR